MVVPSQPLTILRSHAAYKNIAVEARVLVNNFYAFS